MKDTEKQYIECLEEYHQIVKNGLSTKVFKWWGIGILWIVILIGSMLMAAIPVSRLYFIGKYHEFKAVKQSIELARIYHKEDIELRGISSVIAQWNGWLSFWQALNEVPILDFYIPDSIRLIEEMK
jgi:hypothetical protein